MPRGGRRSGQPGALYKNRTDLNGPPAQVPVSAVPGQPYGQAATQIQAQQAVPMAAAPMPAPPAPAGPLPPGPAGQPTPGSFGAFDRPTERPGEPVTAGLPIGPGPGPEALGAMSPTPQTTADLLSRLSYRSPEIQALLAKAQAGNG